MAQKVFPICLIAPSGEAARQSQEIIGKYGKNIGVYQATLEEAVALAGKLKALGAELFISRRGTGLSLEKEYPGQVVQIEEELADYIPALEKARTAEGPVAFFRYGGVPEDVKTMCLMLGIQARYYSFADREDCERAVLEAIREQAVLGIGGADSLYFSRREGLPHLTLENSDQSLLRAIRTAERLLALKRKEQEAQRKLKVQLEQYEMIFRHTRDAVITVDREGKILTWNEEAEKILKQVKKPWAKKSFSGIFSGIQKEEWMQEEKRELSQLVYQGDEAYSLTGISIVVDQNLAGAVLLLQNVKQIQDREKKIRVKLHKKGLEARYRFEDIIGDSRKMQDKIHLARIFAGSEATVLIQGETGTGKELFAQSIHNAGPRALGPFVAVNCGALPRNLLEAELFGYEDGAFTGARKGGKAGLFEMAHGGTIFLDEIGEMPLETQVQLLRVLQEKEIRRIGSDRVIPVDIRVITATNRDLRQNVREHLFREDLYYRLNVLNLRIPPLRERQEDMVRIGLDIFCKYEKEADEETLLFVKGLLEQLKDYFWPGNVRELGNLAERIYVLLSQNEKKEFVETYIRSYFQEAGEETPELEEWEREQLLTALKEHRLNATEAAKALGISRSTMFRKIKKYRIQY